jgi:N-acetylmuramoyl-L-alanine amidase
MTGRLRAPRHTLARDRPLTVLRRHARLVPDERGRGWAVAVYLRRAPACPACLRWVLVMAAVGVVTSACGASAGSASGPPSDAGPASSATHREATQATPTSASRTGASGARPSGTGAPGTGTSSAGAPSAPALPLAGRIVGIDPGHNGLNYTDPAYLDHQVWNGRAWENCDTTGTETDSGYTEALFNFRVASFLRADLARAGARVVMTRSGNGGVGPCVNSRATIINGEHANVVIDIHADGGPASGRGFAILEPVADGPNDAVVTSSGQFGADVRQAFLSGTSMPESSYDGVNGIASRDDLAGLNLTTIPKVLVECGNMRNATDAGLLTSTVFQEQIARALRAAIVRFLS